jgi:hypothetical protein
MMPASKAILMGFAPHGFQMTTPRPEPAAVVFVDVVFEPVVPMGVDDDVDDAPTSSTVQNWIAETDLHVMIPVRKERFPMGPEVCSVVNEYTPLDWEP